MRKGPARRPPGESVYRHPQWVDREGLVVGLVFGLMVVLLAIFIGICALLDAGGHEISQEFLTWGATTAILAPVTLAAVLGGLTLSRNGWVVGLLFGVGFELMTVGSVLPEPVALAIGVALMVLAVPLFFLLGKLRGVPMWLRSPTGGRITVSRGVPEDDHRG